MIAAATLARDLYPTRTVDDISITPRLDPVVYGSPEGPLDAEQIAAYEEDGFIVLPGLLPSSAVDVLNAEVDELAADPVVKERPQSVLEPESLALRSLFEVHLDDGLVAQLVRGPQLAAIARQLLGSQVYIHQSRINLKPGFRGKEFYWHSDFETWHAEDGMPRMRAVSCSILLTPNHTYNGPLLVIAGSHHWFVSCVGETPANHHEQSLRKQEIGTPDDDSLARLAEWGSIAECGGPTGTVVFFDCNAMHGSNSNITPLPRRNVFCVYNSVENELVAPFAADEPRPTYIASRDFTPLP